jgi:uncharacterized cupin superfamily protein
MMSYLTFFNHENLPEARESVPPPERIVEGAPKFKTWDVEKTADGAVRSGVWEATPGAYWAEKGDTWEICTIVSGLSELVEEGQPVRRVKAGDTFVMKPGFKAIWRVIETTRKIWVIHGL